MVVPILNPNMAEALVKLAAALAGVRLEGEHRHVRVVVLGVATVPEETPLSQGASLVRAYRTMLRYIPQNLDPEERLEVQTEVRVARTVAQGIIDQIEDEKADLLLLHWKGNTQTPGKIYGDTLDALLDQPPCDIVLAHFNNGLPAIKNILMPIRGGSHSSLALQLASNLAEDWSANITVLHSLNRSQGSKLGSLEQYYPTNLYENEEEERLALMQDLLQDLPPGARLLTLQGPAVESIGREARFHDMLILGASETRPGLRDEDASSHKLAEQLAQQTECVLLVVKTHKPFELSRPNLGLRSAEPLREQPLEELIDRWFAENIFTYREFRSMSSLTLLKERNNLTISLVMPVYGTIQPMALAETVKKARFALMRDCALVDEIIICAPDSQLDPDEVKAFYQQSGPLDAPSPEELIYFDPTQLAIESAGAPPGLAEALWYSMHRCRGDIIVWADPSMSNFEARLVYGLVGPLLTYPEFQLATGFYSTDDTAIEKSDLIYSNLVEMSLRPLLSGFQPQLAGIINPLCSVGAARRDFLERMPFTTGSAFQVALLADTVQRNGLMSIAQIDLGQQPISTQQYQPHRITADTMTVLLRRAEERSSGTLVSKFHPAVKNIHKSGGVFSLSVEPPKAPLREIPPVIYSPGYHRATFENE